MDLAKVKEQKKQQNIQPEEVDETWEWPDAFYASTDGAARKKALDRAIDKGLEPEENEIRMKIWQKRYGSRAGVDEMLAGWINLLYFANIVKTDRKMKWHKKEMKQSLEALCFDILKEYGEPAEEILYLEFYHLVDFYLDICKNDKKYGSVLLGLGSMSQEKVAYKMAKEVYSVCYKVPPMIGTLKEYDLLRRAASDSFAMKMPTYENLLTHLIETEGADFGEN